MYFFKALSILVLLIAFTIVSITCSSRKSPVEPMVDNPGEMSQEIPDSLGTEDSSRNKLSIYECVIDPDAKTFTVEPISRSSEYHFPLTQMYPDVLQITGFGWTPNFWADIKLTHPFPGSGIDAFDPRVIAILPANPGVSMYYPIFNVRANNSVVLEPDGYTKLFDFSGGSIPGNTNPFRAYFKGEPNRVWSSTGATENTLKWQMDLSGFGGSFEFMLLVDVSTNYPNPPQPVIDNISEPAWMQATILDGLTTDGGEAYVIVTFLDWQGETDINCKVEAPDLFDGVVELSYMVPGPNPNEYVFAGTISNVRGAIPGKYKVLVAAWDINLGNHVFLETIADVDISFHPVDISPNWLNASPNGISYSENYLYIAAGDNGLQIFNVTDPLNPVWVKMVDVLEYSNGVFALDDYAYVASSYGISIFRIANPQSAYLVDVYDTEDAQDVFVSMGYAYVADDTNDNEHGVVVFDINPPESLRKVGVFYCSASKGVIISNGYAYVTTQNGTVEIVRLATRDVVNTINSPGSVQDVVVSGEYAYIADGHAGLQVALIEAPDLVFLVRTVETPGFANSVSVSGDLVYVTDEEYGLHIVDINPPESAYIVKSIDTPGDVEDAVVFGGYASVIDSIGMHILDIDPPASAQIVSSSQMLSTVMDVYYSEGYVYVTDRSLGLRIIDIDPLESAYVVKNVQMPGEVNKLFINQGYAYVANDSDGLQIIDITPPESANIVKTINTSGELIDVYASDSYAYLVSNDDEFLIVNIDPPESAYIINTVDLPDSGSGVFVVDGYAYVANSYSGLTIIDIIPPESAYAVRWLDTPSTAFDVFVSGDYAYVANSSDGLLIFDINPVESAHRVRTIDTDGAAFGVFLSNDYVYVADGSKGLQIVDIESPETAFIVGHIDTPERAINVFTFNDYAYIADYQGGLQIIDLW